VYLNHVGSQICWRGKVFVTNRAVGHSFVGCHVVLQGFLLGVFLVTHMTRENIWSFRGIPNLTIIGDMTHVSYLFLIVLMVNKVFLLRTAI